MGRRLLELLTQQQEGATTEDRWSLLRALAADLQGTDTFERPAPCRRISSLPSFTPTAYWSSTGPQSCRSLVANFLAEMPQTEWGDELLRLYSELHTVRLLLNAEEPSVLLGGCSAAPPGEDVALTPRAPQAPQQLGDVLRAYMRQA